MRKALLAWALVVALAGLSRVRGEDAPGTATSTTVPRAPIEHTTTIQGTLPDLEGRWLLLASVSLAQGAKRLLPSVLDVRRSDGTLEVRERHVILPAAQSEALRRANEELGGVWMPSPADLDAIDRAWETLEPEDRSITRMEHHLVARDAFDDALKTDAVTKDAMWVLRQSYSFIPGGNRPTRQVNLIAPLKVENGVYSGNYLAVTLVAAPFPVPIKFEGTFQLIPVGRGTPRSWWAWLGDFFAGCGRR